MKIDKVAKPVARNPPNTGRFTDDELKRVTDFFSLLIKIDQRNKKKEDKNENI